MTRDGRPAVWEAGGGSTNTGGAVVVCDANGAAKAAAYVARGGHLACGQHALIPVEAGDYVVAADHRRGDFQVSVRPVVADDEGGLRLGAPVATYAEGVWLPAVADDDAWHSAVRAAAEKAQCYHCRETHFVAPPRHAAMGAEG